MKIYTVQNKGQILYTCVDRRMAEDYIRRYKRDNNAVLIDEDSLTITEYAKAQQCLAQFNELDVITPQPNNIKSELEHYCRIERGQQYVLIQDKRKYEKDNFSSFLN